MRSKATILFSVIMITLSLSVQAQTLEYVGSALWTGAEDVKVRGQYAFCAFNNGLMILDISKQQEPIPVGRLYCSGRTIPSLDLAGDFAYLADERTGLTIVDVSDVSNPVEVGVCPAPGASEVFVSGSSVYMVSNRNEPPGEPSMVYIVDVADPSNPYMAGSFEAPYDARDICAVGDVVYVIDRGLGLDIYDATDPGSPVRLGGWEPFSGGVAGICVAGNYAYILGYSGPMNGLHILDISDPSAPIDVGHYWVLVGTSQACIDVSGDFAYFGGLRGLEIVDVSDPHNPAFIGRYLINGSSSNQRGVFVSDGTAVLAANTLGIHLIDVSEPTAPEQISVYADHGDIWSVVVSGGIACAGTGTGLEIVDFTDPASPEAVGSVDLPNAVFGVAVQGSHAFTAGRDMHIVNITDPSDPVLVSSLDSVFARRIHLEGDLAYLACYSRGLQIVDISDVSDPTWIGEDTTATDAQDVVVENGLAYIADGMEGGLQIVDVTDPANPVWVGQYAELKYAYSVSVQNSHAFISSGIMGVFAIDVSDPANPSIADSTGFHGIHGSTLDNSVSGEFAYVATDIWGLSLLSITDPASPLFAEVTSYDTPGESRAVCLADDYIYVADRFSLIALQCTGCTPTMRVAGDVDASGEVDIDDLLCMISYIFKSGPAPDPQEAGDVNCSGTVDIDDVISLMEYIFLDGNAPCDTNGDDVPDC